MIWFGADMIHVVKTMVNGEPCFEKPLQEILAGLDVGWGIEVHNPGECMSVRQRAWFKGVLLPALSKDNGDTVRKWQGKLVEAIFPEDCNYDDNNNLIYPSIQGYSQRKMNTLIEESVAKCHEWGFTWVTLPDSDLRR